MNLSLGLCNQWALHISSVYKLFFQIFYNGFKKIFFSLLWTYYMQSYDVLWISSAMSHTCRSDKYNCLIEAWKKSLLCVILVIIYVMKGQRVQTFTFTIKQLNRTNCPDSATRFVYFISINICYISIINAWCYQSSWPGL